MRLLSNERGHPPNVKHRQQEAQETGAAFFVGAVPTHFTATDVSDAVLSAAASRLPTLVCRVSDCSNPSGRGFAFLELKAVPKPGATQGKHDKIVSAMTASRVPCSDSLVREPVLSGQL